MSGGAMNRPIRATYRLQLHRAFGFRAAADIVEYLAALGISHLYCSPILQATPGSMHGYDVVDPQRVSDDLGGAAAFDALCAAAAAHGLGLVLDIVPNHMAIGGGDNRWWWDVLENGPASRYAGHFDVDWDPPESKLRNLVLVPILGDHYGRVLDARGIRLAREPERIVIRSGDHVLPVAPPSLAAPLAAAAARAGSETLAAIADALAALPSATATDPASVARRHRGKEWLRSELARLCRDEPRVGAAIDAEIGDINADPARLHELLERQNYRLAFWRTASRELGYRRFFDIATLVGLRVEDRDVFADTHALIAHWLGDGTLDGVRVDHPDGLRDPQAYFERLRAVAPEAWIVAEKILEPGERLRASWPIDGTTGYDFMQRVSAVCVDPEGIAPLTAIYAEFLARPCDYAELVRAKKHQALHGALAAELNRLTAQLVDVCERHPRQRDYTRHALHEAIREVIVAFPVYRTYVRAPASAVDPDDVAVVEAATADAAARRPDLEPALFEFLRDLLLLRTGGDLGGELAMRFQQLTGPVMAKAVEDGAFYCFNRFVAANEVGGDPGQLATSLSAFHAACADAQAHWPRAMLASSTHDTKRSEDVRARLLVLSEVPDAWRRAVGGWAEHNARHRSGEWPDRNSEYLYYQTLVGAWPIDADRAHAYMRKAIREAKEHTSWIEPNAAYEQAVEQFVTATLGDPIFTRDLERFVAEIVEPGWITALAQTAIKLTAPGVPDTYQGCELWDLSLVDPDNRRPVDYAARRALLAAVTEATPEAVWERRATGAPKLWLIRRACALRRARAESFDDRAGYRPLCTSGARAAHVIAFARGDGVAVVVPRWIARLGGRWLDTTVELPAGRWRNWLTGDAVAGGSVGMADALRRFPVALFARE
jgi:(1->4)-alpha-D-glucan 1-alpha-D-glucosylmutase